MKVKNKKIVLTVLGILIVLLSVIGITYAFFSAKIKENNKTETVIKTNELNIVFTGTQEINCSNIIPGDSCIKKFTVENISNVPVEYNIYMEKITNEFNEDLVYTLEDETGSVIGETPLPVTNKDKSYLKTAISIEANTKKTYTMKILYKYLNTPQDDYQGKSFKGTLGIDTELVDNTYSMYGTVYKNEGNNKVLVTEGNLVFFSEHQDVAITSDGKFEATNLETGNHEVYYMGNIDASSLTKEEIKNQALCTSTFKMATSSNEIILDCKNKNDDYSLKDITIKKEEAELQGLLCRRATKLHSEVCNQSNNIYYCHADGYLTGISEITYGKIGSSGSYSVGDAYDCDVNGDGIFDDVTERFYYISTLTNGIEKDSNIAVLVYYNNVINGESSNEATSLSYDKSGKNNNGPVGLLSQLPTTKQWKNTKLSNSVRQITNENNELETSDGPLVKFSYEGYAARLLTYQELYKGCYDKKNTLTSMGGLNAKCKFLYENTKYSSNSQYINSYWLETPSASDEHYVGEISGYYRSVDGANVSWWGLGVRPVIEVPKERMQYY